MSWIGPGAWTSWKDMAGVQGPSASSTDTGQGFIWWRGRAGGYYRVSFSGERSMTQGYPLLPTIFNVLVDAVVRHWD